MPTRTISMFEADRLTLEDSIDLTRQSLLAYGSEYRHWAIAYSGGKDSTATAAAVVHLIETQQIPRPATLTVLYADTRQEIPPLHFGAMQMLEAPRRGLRADDTDECAGAAVMNDPFLAGARALKHALDTGMISRAQYDTMYAALSSAAEQDSVACSTAGCTRAAYIGTHCAHHTDAETVRQLVRERYQ